MKIANRHTYWTCFAVAMFLSIGMNVPAESASSDPTHRPLFDDDSTLAVTIEGPLRTVMRNRDETDEFPAIIKYSNADGTETTLDVKLNVRGKFRRKRETCNFAPLRVNFRKKQVEGTLFAGQNTIKLVTDCQSSKKWYQQLLLKEYLAYKLLNVLSDKSFSARLLRVTYVDTANKNKSRESYAFFIEEKSHIADRLGMERVKAQKIKYAALNSAHANMINVYEYFIANTDYSLVAGPLGSNCCRNAILLSGEDDKFIPVPYDFDFSGLVNAPYALHNPRFKVRSVRDRVYRGRCANNAHLDATVELFVAKREEFNQLIRGLDGFDDKSTKLTLKFIDGFYKDIATPKAIRKKLTKKCS